MVEQRIQFLVLETDATTFDGVEYLGRMEAEHGCIAESRRAIAASVFVHALDAEGMGSIIDDLKPVTVSDLLDSINIAKIAVNMHRHDGAGARGD